jgi:hypothetical protein
LARNVRFRDSDTGETTLDVVSVPEGLSLQIALVDGATVVVGEDGVDYASVILSKAQADELRSFIVNNNFSSGASPVGTNELPHPKHRVAGVRAQGTSPMFDEIEVVSSPEELATSLDRPPTNMKPDLIAPHHVLGHRVGDVTDNELPPVATNVESDTSGEPVADHEEATEQLEEEAIEEKDLAKGDRVMFGHHAGGVYDVSVVHTIAAVLKDGGVLELEELSGQFASYLFVRAPEPAT